SVELGRVQFKPSHGQIDVANRRGIARLRRLAKIDGGHKDALGGQRLVDATIVSPIAVVPCASVHINDGRKWPRSLGLIDASQPRFARLLLILDIPHVYFVFIVIHGLGLYNRARRCASSRRSKKCTVVPRCRLPRPLPGRPLQQFFSLYAAWLFALLG